ncbi:unnamed protein product (macronuclear) [Paramecium tetraurelia]|uniref:Bromo domain-containing protein n=1 Tax=Paramecium tetraurelia TaxID=5888 RepID=A0BKG9_PARTE|nr:uncharacterized protein GSPATT00029667001 [Paramecium tetraurelia]CAK59036.1 unnamed protein product [Paramecium tetraurelia]|eukprot:XP_001426434.1 hypothetical protein (macronuclear) [Paramecium tetraurelia strain d4-2]
MMAQLQQKLLEIIENLINNPISLEFVDPYDDEDYNKVIFNKMDLTTIKKKLESNKYLNHTEFFKDLDLVWKNCQLYNQKGSIIFKQSMYLEQQCKSLQKVIEDDFNLGKKKKRQNQERPPIQQQSFDFRQKNKPSNEASRLKFCHSIKNLEQEQLIKIVNYLAEFQPECLSREEDKLVIDVKKLDSKACEQINLL